MKQISILLVSGNSDDYAYMNELISHLKSYRFWIDFADSFESALNALRRNHYAIALVEDDLGTMRGSQFIMKAKQNGIDVPIILFTSSENWQSDEAAFQSGAIYCLDREKMTAQKLTEIILKEMDLRRFGSLLQIQGF